MIVPGYEKPTRVEFIEGGHLTSMTVDQDMDQEEECNQASSTEEFDYEDVEQDISFRWSSQRESTSENSSDEEEDDDNEISDAEHEHNQTDVSEGEINQSEDEEGPSENHRITENQADWKRDAYQIEGATGDASARRYDRVSCRDWGHDCCDTQR